SAPGPFLSSALRQSWWLLGRAALARPEIGADLLHTRLPGGGIDGRERGGMKLGDNRRGCSLGQEGGKPVRCVEIGQPLLMRGRLRRQARRAIAREDRDRLDHL